LAGGLDVFGDERSYPPEVLNRAKIAFDKVKKFEPPPLPNSPVAPAQTNLLLTPIVLEDTQAPRQVVPWHCSPMPSVLDI
jgi:hypothetical protein